MPMLSGYNEVFHVAGSRATGRTQSMRWRCLLARGHYTLRVYATDLAGNPQTLVGHRALTVR